MLKRDVYRHLHAVISNADNKYKSSGCCLNNYKNGGDWSTAGRCMCDRDGSKRRVGEWEVEKCFYANKRMNERRSQQKAWKLAACWTLNEWELPTIREKAKAHSLIKT